MGYDTGKSYLRGLELSLGSAAPWTVSAGLLVLEPFQLDLALAWSAPGATAVVTGSVRAPLVLGEMEIVLEARSPAAGDPWVLSGYLSTGAELDFAALLEQFVTHAVLPSGWSFPASVTLETLEVEVVPAERSLTVYGAAFTDWSFTFAGGSFSVTGLQGWMVVKEGGKETGGWIGGTFAFAGVKGAATVALGGADAAFRVAVAVTNAADVSPMTQVDALCGTGTYAAVPVPSGFTAPSFFSAGALLDLTAGRYLVHGEFASGSAGLYGAVVLLVQKEDDGSWGFALAAALQTWSFTSLTPALAGVDAVLGVKSAGAAVALLSLQGAAAAKVLAPFIPALKQDLASGAGLYVCATLDFTAGLTAKLVPLLNVSAAGPFTVQGFIPRDAGASTFTATLGSLSLLGTLTFSGLVLTYTPRGGGVLTLTGTIGLSVPLLSGTGTLAFPGAMTVDATRARFSVASTPQSLQNPLGIPGITLGSLGLTLEYDFAGGTTTTGIVGSTTIGGVALNGMVVFDGVKPVVAVLQIGQALSIDAIFSKLLGSSWPTGLLDITLRQGSLWYAPSTVTVGTQTWKAGLHASARVNVYSLVNLQLEAGLTPASDGSAGHMTATARTADPIDWGFVVFSDPDDANLGPRVSIDTAAGAFDVDCGITLLGTECTARLSVGPETMTGKATVDTGSIFGTQTLAFTWNDADGFQVTEWPLSGLQLPEFSFTDIPGAGGCTGTVISSLPIDTEFDLKASLAVSLAPTPVLTIKLSGSFDLVCDSAVYEGTVLTAQVVDATLTVPLPGSGAFTWDALADSFVECLQQAAGSIFRNLVEDPENLAKLLAVGGVEFVAKDIADYLVCRGASRAAAVTFAEAATSAVAVTFTLVVGGVGFLVTLGGVVGSFLDWLFSNDGSGARLGSIDGPTPEKPARPAAPALSWSAGRLQVSWTAVTGATSYAVSYRDGDTWTSTSQTAEASLSLGVRAGPKYAVCVTAAGPGGVSAAGPESTFQSVGAPVGLTAAFTDPSIVASWGAAAGASVYQAVVSQGAPRFRRRPCRRTPAPRACSPLRRSRPAAPSRWRSRPARCR